MNFTNVAALANKPLLQQVNNALPKIISVALVVAIGYTLATLSWQIYQSFQQPENTIAANNSNNIKLNQPPKQDVRQITTAWLFGKAQSAAIAPVQENAPVSKLNLVLRGVLAADPQELALAIIANGKGGKEEIYAIGDIIQRGVKLSEIHPDHVIITRNGRAEKLVLVKSSGKLSGNSFGRNQSSKQTSKGTTLREIRQQIMKNPTSFGEYALPIVVKQNGKQIGYRLKPQKKGDLLMQYGLMPSDIITEINGVKLDNPQNGIKALRELSSASSVTLTVKRGQSFVPLNIQLQ